MRGTIFLTLGAFVGSILLNICLFSFLPLMTYFTQHQSGDKKITQEMKVLNLAMMPKKKEKQKSQESHKQVEKKSLEPGKSVSRQRFVMDLGAGGGSGAAVGNGGVSGGDLKQMSYAEGETDVDAVPVFQSAPKRPKKAESAGVTGIVRCLLTIGENGQVVDIQFLETPGNFGYEEVIREELSRWRYRPATVGGIAVKQRIEQPFKF